MHTITDNEDIFKKMIDIYEWEKRCNNVGYKQI